PEPHLSIGLVDAVNAAHDPGARGNGVVQFPGDSIYEVEVPPAIAFGGVNDFLALLQPMNRAQIQVLRVRRPNEGFAPLINKVARGTGARLDLDHAQALVPSIGLLISETAAVLGPTQTRAQPLVLESIHLRLRLLPAVDVEQV